MRTLRIGNGSAYWGDMLDPAAELAEKGELDYLGLDHLSELTMAILQRMKNKNPERGYIPDLIPWTEALLPHTHRNGVKMITNAGGTNPEAGAQRVVELARGMGITGFKIGTVSGDDVYGKLDTLAAEGVEFVNLDTGEEGLDRIRDKIVAANVYIGSEPIVEALEGGAEMVIAGRVSDSALSIGPIMHEFGWNFERPDWDKIGAAISVGHIIECACFCTGGGSGQWREATESWHIGFPIAEFSEDGTAVITKVEGSGGVVNQWTVKEQITYEVADPRNYMMPDGIADFTTLQLEEIGSDRVRVTNMSGKPRPDTLKLTIGFQDGWIAEGLLLYSWPDALAKAQRSEDIVRKRLKRLGIEPEEIRFDYLGLDTLHGRTAAQYKGMPDLGDPRLAAAGELEERSDYLGRKPSARSQLDFNEVGLRMAAKCRTREEADLVRREATHLWTIGGVGTAFGVPFRPRPVIALWPTLIPRAAVKTEVRIQAV
jgi:hypothetical protein